MRTASVALGIILGFLSIARAMPLVPLAAQSQPVRVHGCHQHYAHDVDGWHRHQKGCALPGLAGGKAQSPVKD
jgi:hypothetical protein